MLGIELNRIIFGHGVNDSVIAFFDRLCCRYPDKDRSRKSDHSLPVMGRIMQVVMLPFSSIADDSPLVCDQEIRALLISITFHPAC
jgi:hypothetical protein